MRYRNWLSDAGVPWPWKDEFEVGCTLEHAGYYVTWFTAFFGPARSVTSFSKCLVPDKETDVPLDVITPDFSVATIEFENGFVARLTNSIYAKQDHRLRIFGDDGVLSLNECWQYDAPVYLQRRSAWALRAEKWPTVSKLLGLSGKKMPLIRNQNYTHKYKGNAQMDFARGVAELARAVSRGTRATLDAQYSLHVNEIVLAIQNPHTMGCPRQLTTTFELVEPLPRVS